MKKYHIWLVLLLASLCFSLPVSASSDTDLELKVDRLEEDKEDKNAISDLTADLFDNDATNAITRAKKRQFATEQDHLKGLFLTTLPKNPKMNTKTLFIRQEAVKQPSQMENNSDGATDFSSYAFLGLLVVIGSVATVLSYRTFQRDTATKE